VSQLIRLNRSGQEEWTRGLPKQHICQPSTWMSFSSFGLLIS